MMHCCLPESSSWELQSYHKQRQSEINKVLSTMGIYLVTTVSDQSSAHPHWCKSRVHRLFGFILRLLGNTMSSKTFMREEDSEKIQKLLEALSSGVNPIAAAKKQWEDNATEIPIPFLQPGEQGEAQSSTDISPLVCRLASRVLSEKKKISLHSSS